jgi:ABC-type antimicrobial peptide transport system permease subunit
MTTLTAVFGALAMVLALVGIYAVMGCAVAERTREIAIRVAVGARMSDVVRLIVLKAVALAAVGVAAGLLAAWAASRTLAGLLFGVTAGDVPTYLVSAAALLVVAVTAAAVPAFRASRIDGAHVLRS